MNKPNNSQSDSPQRRLEELSRAIDNNPKDASAYTNRGIVYDALKRYDEALKDLTRAIALDPNLAIAYQKRGVTYLHLMRYDAALADCNRAIALDPKFARAYNSRGNAYNGLDRYDEAVADYTRAIELDPNLVIAYQNRAHVYNALGQCKEAHADFTRAIELEPNNASAYITRSDNTYGEMSIEEKLADYTRAIELDPTMAHAYTKRGDYNNLFGTRFIDKALADYNRAIEIDPKHLKAYIGRGNAYRKLKRYDKALADLTYAIELDPQNADSYSARGRFYESQGRHDKALADYNRAIELDPIDANKYRTRGCLYEKLKRYGAVIADYTRTIELTPVRPNRGGMAQDESDWRESDDRQKRGYAYLELNRYDDALTDFTKLIELTPGDSFAYIFRGLVYETLKRYDDALADFTRAIELDLKSAFAFHCRGNLYNTLKRYNEALADADQALCLKPDGDTKLRALRIKSAALTRLDRLDEANITLLEAESVSLQDVDIHVIRLNYYLRRNDMKGLRQCSKALLDIVSKDEKEPELVATNKEDDPSFLTGPTEDDFPPEPRPEEFDLGTPVDLEDYLLKESGQQTSTMSHARIAALSQLQKTEVHDQLAELAPEFALEQWLVFIAVWFKANYVEKQTYYDYVKSLDVVLASIRGRKTDSTHSTVAASPLSDEIKQIHNTLFSLPGDMDAVGLEEIWKSGPELFAFKMKLALLSHVMQVITPVPDTPSVLNDPGHNKKELVAFDEDPIEMRDFRRFTRAVYFYKRLSEALNQEYAELIVQNGRKKAEEVMTARIEERNKVIQDLSHSIKNIVASIVDPLNELSERFSDERVTIQKALRGATMIRETVNAMNLSFRGNLEDFARDAYEAVLHPEKTVGLDHLIEVSLECSVNNMFDGKYFADFVHRYFPTRPVFEKAKSAWDAVHTGNGTELMLTFLKQYMFDITLNYPLNIKELRLGDRHNSPLKLTLLFQELLLNAVKYACFAERKERFVSVSVSADDHILTLFVQNAFVPGQSARTTRIGNEIVNNFVKLLEGTISVGKTESIYTATVTFPNIFNKHRREMIIKY